MIDPDRPCYRAYVSRLHFSGPVRQEISKLDRMFHVSRLPSYAPRLMRSGKTCLYSPPSPIRAKITDRVCCCAFAPGTRLEPTNPSCRLYGLVICRLCSLIEPSKIGAIVKTGWGSWSRALQVFISLWVFMSQVHAPSAQPPHETS